MQCFNVFMKLGKEFLRFFGGLWSAVKRGQIKGYTQQSRRNLFSGIGFYISIETTLVVGSTG
jgi:hypothetical protein